MQLTKRSAALAACGLACLLGIGTSVGLAQNAPVRVRGTIERVEGPALTVKARDGQELKVALADNALIVSIIAATLADIKPGSFIGVTGMPQADGSQRALEVHIFPEAMRGTGEGHYAWDLQPESTMTNGNIDDMVTAVDGRTLMVRYKDGVQKIVVPQNAPIVTYQPADRSALQPGAKVFIAAARPQADGTLLAPRVNVGKDGLTPPM
jgi:hypothetical protein